MELCPSSAAPENQLPLQPLIRRSEAQGHRRPAIGYTAGLLWSLGLGRSRRSKLVRGEARPHTPGGVVGR